MTAGSGLASAVSLLPKITARNTLRGGADGVSPIRIVRRSSSDAADLLPLYAEDGVTKQVAVDSTFRLTSGIGDSQYLFVPTTGSRFETRHGTNALPDASLHPVHKVTRTMAVAPKTNIASIVGNGATVTVTTATPHLLQAGVLVDIAGTVGFNTGTGVHVTVATVVSPTVFTYASAIVGSETTGTAQQYVQGNSIEQGAAIVGLCVGQTPNAIQATGGTFIGIGNSTAVDPRNDAAGVVGFSVITATGSTNGAEGGYLAGRRMVTTARALGLEIQAQDYAADAGYSTNGYSFTYGMTISGGAATNGFNIGAGLILGRAGPVAMHVGIICPAYSTAGDGNGPCIEQFIGDYGKSLTSVYVGGSHSTGGVVIDDLAGSLLVGIGARSGDNVGCLAVIRDSVGSTGSAALWIGSQTQAAGASKAHFLQMTNFSGRHRLWIAGVAGDFMVGSQPGDGGLLAFNSGSKFIMGGFNGGGSSRAPVFTFTYDGKGSVFGATPVLQQSNTQDLRAGLINFGLFASGSGAMPLDLLGGALGSGSHTLADGANIVVGTGTGTKIGTSASQKLALWNATPTAQPTGRVTLSNYTSAPRTFDRNNYTEAQLADLVCEIFSILRTIGAHA
jgi:hypothetical protein